MQQKIWRMTLTQPGEQQMTADVPHDEMISFLNDLIYGGVPRDAEVEVTPA